MTNEKLNKLPKVELHMHLDGSILVQYVKEKYNLTDEEIKEKMVADEKCKNLNDYLTRFDYPISIMQTKEELNKIIVSLLESLKKQNVIYVEIRFAPQFHTQKGLTQEEVVATLIEAKNTVDIKSNLILCIMRGDNNMDANFETVNVAKKFLGKGVCAVDLAGAEAVFKTQNYEEIFKYVRDNHIPYTIHAGEADGPESIKAALKFGAKRIGHGVRAIEDRELLNTIIADEITLEVCPTSNIQTCICDSYKTHPIEKLYSMGVRTTINTDNMTVSNTTLEKEYEGVIDNTNLGIEDIIEMNINAINAAFISKEEKLELLKKYQEGL